MENTKPLPALTPTEFKSKVKNLIAQYVKNGRGENFCDHQAIGKMEDLTLMLDEAVWECGIKTDKLGRAFSFFFKHHSAAINAGCGSVAEWVVETPQIRREFFDRDYNLI